MKESERWMWAAGIVVVDFLVFALPLVALLAAYFIIARPASFKAWVDKLYQA